MKRSILTFLTLFLLCFCALGQKSESYKFVYRIHLDAPNDTTEFQIDTLKNLDNLSTLKALIKNNQSKPISSLTIVLKNTDTTITTMTNEEGLFLINVKPSNYELTIAGVGYKTLTKQINVDTDNDLNLRVSLARQTPMNWYNIHSRKKLSQSDIDNIKNCLQNNGETLDKCKKKYNYYLTLEI